MAGKADSGNVKLTPIDLDKLAEKNEEIDKVNRMSIDEVAVRLGAFRFWSQSKVSMSRGKRQMRLTETSRIWQQSKGNFRVLRKNRKGEGVEMFWINQLLFVKNRYGQFRVRRSFRNEHLKQRRQAYKMWRTLYELFKPNIEIRHLGGGVLKGREVLQFGISLKAIPSSPVKQVKTKVQDKKVSLGKLKLPIALRKAWHHKRRPQKASGKIVVDRKVGVIISCEFEGRIDIPIKKKESAEKKKGAVKKRKKRARGVRMNFWFRSRMSSIGSEPRVEPPAKYIPAIQSRGYDSDRFNLINMKRIEDFLIDKYEYPNQLKKMPATHISARKAHRLCRKLGKRLCSLQEWRTACTSGKRRRRYPYGTLYRSGYCHTEGESPIPIGSRKQCKGDQKVFDMVGNVAEWVRCKKCIKWRSKEEGRRRRCRKWSEKPVGYCLVGGGYDSRSRGRCFSRIPRREVKILSDGIGFRCCR